MTIINIAENKDIPSLAEMLYEMYSIDAIPFTVDALRKTIEFLNELYPNTSKEKQEKMNQILKLEIITKFCAYAENLAAIAVTFTFSYDDVKKETMGLYNKIGEYNVNQVINFYENIQNRDPQYIAKFIGYPPLILQQKQTKEVLERSCLTIKEEIKKISDLYLEFRLLYNAYKHGYRVFFGKDDKTNDTFAFIEKGKNQRALIVDKNRFDEIVRAIRHIRKIIELIFDSHKERVKYENGKKDVTIKMMRPVNSESFKDDAGTKIYYPSRGECRKAEDEEFKKVYDKFKEELERSDLGKYVLIDIDEEKILGIDNSVENLIEKIAESDSSGRKRITKIGSNESMYEMY